jgi:hypothetical protein
MRVWFRQQRRALHLCAALGVAADTSGIASTRLEPETIDGWNAYVAATERRRADERHDSRRFFATEFQGGAAGDLAAALGGAPIARPAEDGAAVDVPSGLVHHWIGTVFVPGTTVDRVISSLRTDPPARSEDVLQSAILSRSSDGLVVFLRLRRSRFVTVVYNTEHAVTLRRLTAGTAESWSRSLRIAEVADPGTPQEHELPVGADRGFLWRLNAYWRYRDVPGGVLAECESITLSRRVPYVLRLVAGPLIDGAARESMERTLAAFRDSQRR